MVPQELVDLARASFEAYCDAVGGRNYAGDPIPAWDDLGSTVQEGWIASTEFAYGTGFRDAVGRFDPEPRFPIR